MHLLIDFLNNDFTTTALQHLVGLSISLNFAKFSFRIPILLHILEGRCSS